MDKIINLPFISVIIPVYNADKTLEQTIRSVLDQTYSHFEIIIIDDGSDYSYTSILQSLSDKRISYFKLRHANANVARNFGISKSTGDYIAMLDADDIWLPNHLESCLRTIKEEESDGLYGSLIIKGERDVTGKQIIVREINKDETVISYLLKTGYGAQTSTLFLSAESVSDIKWDESLNRHQDYDFVVRYCKKYKLKPKVEPTVIYRISLHVNKIDFKSCIKFIEQNEKDIEPLIYNKYHQNMWALAINQGAKKDVIDYYKRKSVKNLEYISYAHYNAIIEPESWVDKFKCKFSYIFYILKIV